MSDIVLNPIGSGYNLSKFNVNFQAIEDKINNEILHLSGGNNLMGQSLDMNSNRIINLPEPVSGHEPVRFQDYINFDSQIQSLAQSSAQGDAALSNSIQSESASRQAADANLQNQINSNDADISDLESEIGLLAPSTDPEAKNKVTSLSDITSLSSLNTAALVGGQQFSVGSYLPDTSTGSALLRWRPDLPKSRHDGVLFFSPTVPMFTGTDTTDYRNRVGETDPTGSGVMELVRGEIIYDASVLVPSHFSSKQEAIDSLYGRVSATKGKIIDVVMESGFVPTTGVFVSDGDYRKFRISSSDAEVTVAAGFGQSAAFVEGHNATLPTLNCMVNGNSGALGKGYVVEDNSVGFVTAGSGCRSAWQDGLSVKYSSRCYLESGAKFTGNAVNGTTSSNIHAISSIIHADGVDATGSNYFGVQSTSGATISFRGGDASGATIYGLRARDEGSIDAESAFANNCGTYGAYCFLGGHLVFRNGQANNCGSGLVVTRGSTCEAVGVSVDSSTNEGIIVTGGSIFDGDDAAVTNSGSVGVRINCCTANLFGATITGSSGRGVSAEGACDVNLDSATVNSNGTAGVRGFGCSSVSAKNASIKFNTPGVEFSHGASIDLENADCQENNTRGIYAYLGGRISASGTLCQKIPGTDTGSNQADITCLQGGHIDAFGASGGLNKVANSLSSDGVIYQ